MNPNSNLPAAAIFDMDGVLVNSNPFHLQKWIDLFNAHHIPFDREVLPRRVLGPRNDTTFRRFFGPRLTAADRRRLSEELEASFRRAFHPHAKPLPGLEALLMECQRAGVAMAVASSAMSKNVEFIVDALGFRPYFRCLVTGDEVTHPKPDPEIYVKAARKLGLEPAACVAFEDSFVGVEAARRAGMKCVAIASTFPLEELRAQTQADLVVNGFEELNLQALRQLFSANRTELQNSPQGHQGTKERKR
jgi:HAD superfamily hydrolase (TIGR01509 family)